MSDTASMPGGTKNRLLLLAANSLSFWHCAITAGFVFVPWTNWGFRLLASLLWFYIAPPFAARIVTATSPPQEGRIPPDNQAFFSWWFLFNLQVVFCRFPACEELLRLVPGLYSCWLRLWGARIGRLTYWAAGTLILDRSFLQIGDDVIFGAGVRLNPHVLAKDAHGQLELHLGTIVIGDRATVGGYSLLTAGTEIAPDECTRAFTISPPFSKWKDGRRAGKLERTA